MLPPIPVVVFSTLEREAIYLPEFLSTLNKALLPFPKLNGVAVLMPILSELPFRFTKIGLDKVSVFPTIFVT